MKTVKIEVREHTTMELEAVHIINVNEEYSVSIEFENKILTLQLVSDSQS